MLMLLSVHMTSVLFLVLVGNSALTMELHTSSYSSCPFSCALAYPLWMWFLWWFLPGCTCQLEGITDWNIRIFLHPKLLSDGYSTSFVVHTNPLASHGITPFSSLSCRMEGRACKTHTTQTSSNLYWYIIIWRHTCIDLWIHSLRTQTQPWNKRIWWYKPKFLGLGSVEAL